MPNSAHILSIKVLVNLGRRLRFFYDSWFLEHLFTFVKVAGATGLENSRPVGLLEILLKSTLAFDYADLSKVWEEQGLLHASQDAFRRGRGTETAQHRMKCDWNAVEILFCQLSADNSHPKLSACLVIP